MAFLTQVATNTLSNQNISTALNVLTYTNTSRIRELQINVFIDQIAGNGSYTCYATVQRSGAGSTYQESPITAASVASGVTAIAFASILLTINATDVLKIWVLGLAGDTTTPDIITDVNEIFLLTDSNGQVTAADVKAINAIATTSVTAVNANIGTTQPINFTGTGASALTKSDLIDIASVAVNTALAQLGANVVNYNAQTAQTDANNLPKVDLEYWRATQPSTLSSGLVQADVERIVNAVVNTALAQLGVNVVSQANIDFGALQKGSLNAATPAVTVSDKTGFSLSAVGILAIWNQLKTDVGLIANSLGKLLADNLDATISSRVKPTDTLARVTLVDTTTNLTNNTPTIGNVTLATSQPNYAPAKAGDAMTLTSPYDAAKTASTQTSVNAIPTNPLLTTDARLNDLDATISSRSTLTQSQILSDNTPFLGANIALIKTDTTNLINRLGAFAGSGLNTALGFLRAMSRNDSAITPSDMGGTYSNLTQSLQAIAGSEATPPTVQQIVDGVWDEPIVDHLDSGSTGATLQLASSQAGTGFYTVEIPCEVSGVPADGVAVRVANDLAGTDIVAQATSDTNGVAVVYLDGGSFYVFLARGGDTFPNPTLITVP